MSLSSWLKQYKEDLISEDIATRHVFSALNTRERLFELKDPKMLMRIKDNRDMQERWFKDVLLTRSYYMLGQLVTLEMYGSEATDRLEYIAREQALNEIDDKIIPTYTYLFGDVTPKRFELDPRITPQSHPYKFWKNEAA